MVTRYYLNTQDIARFVYRVRWRKCVFNVHWLSHGDLGCLDIHLSRVWNGFQWRPIWWHLISITRVVGHHSITDICIVLQAIRQRRVFCIHIDDALAGNVLWRNVEPPGTKEEHDRTDFSDERQSQHVPDNKWSVHFIRIDRCLWNVPYKLVNCVSLLLRRTYKGTGVRYRWDFKIIHIYSQDCGIWDCNTHTQTWLWHKVKKYKMNIHMYMHMWLQ